MSDFKKKVIKGGKWTSLESVFNAVFQIIRIMVLARLLEPEDYGIMTMALIVMGVSNIFMDFGISNAIIFKQDANHKQLSSLYWVNVSIGFVLAISVFLLSGPLALFFEEPKLESVLKYMSLIFFVTGFAMQYHAILRKELMFPVLAKIGMSTAIASFLTTLTLAYLGFGVFALVAGYFVQMLGTASAKIFFGRKFHIPEFYFSYPEIKFFLNFGVTQLGERMISYLRQQGDSLIIGTYLATDVLGLYSVAKLLIKKPIIIINSILGKMAFPVFAKIKEDGKLKEWSEKIFVATCLMIFPIFAVSATMPEETILFFYGEKWVSAAPILQLLSVLFSIRLLRTTFGPLLISRGKVKESLRYNLIFTVVALLILWVLIPIKITYALWGLIAGEIILMLPLCYNIILKPVIGMTISRFALLISKVVLPAIATILAISALIYVLPDINMLRLFLGAFVGLLVFVATAYSLNKKDMSAAYHTLRKRIG